MTSFEQVEKLLKLKKKKPRTGSKRIIRWLANPSCCNSTKGKIQPTNKIAITFELIYSAKTFGRTTFLHTLSQINATDCMFKQKYTKTCTQLHECNYCTRIKS